MRFRTPTGEPASTRRFRYGAPDALGGTIAALEVRGDRGRRPGRARGEVRPGRGEVRSGVLRRARAQAVRPRAARPIRGRGRRSWPRVRRGLRARPRRALSRGTRALEEMTRVMAPGGLMLIAFHGGSGQVHAEDWFDEKLSISATLFEPDEMRGYMEAAGLAVDDISARDPYDFEYPTRRVYAAATKRYRSGTDVDEPLLLELHHAHDAALRQGSRALRELGQRDVERLHGVAAGAEREPLALQPVERRPERGVQSRGDEVPERGAVDDQLDRLDVLRAADAPDVVLDVPEDELHLVQSRLVQVVDDLVLLRLLLEV